MPIWILTAGTFIKNNKGLLKWLAGILVVLLVLGSCFYAGYSYKSLKVDQENYEILKEEVAARQKVQKALDKLGIEAAETEGKLRRENQLLLDKRKYETPKDPVCSDRKLSPERVLYLRNA